MQDLWQTTIETVLGILPIIVFLLFFNLVILQAPLENARQIIIGLILSVVGLLLFIEGLRMGIIPLGQSVGLHLPERASLWLVLFFGFFMGYGVTLAEPALQALAVQVEELSAGILRRQIVVHVVAFGVGTGVTLGLVKIVFGIATSTIVIPAFLATAALAYFAPGSITGVAFDAGGVTTGPVTVPVITALGIGLATALGGRDPLLDGFGIIALASVGPIISVLILGLIFRF